MPAERYADCAPQLHRRIEQTGARFRREIRRRRLFDHLLIAPLRRAIALAERNDVARAIAEELHLDVARSLDVLLEEQPAVAEVVLREPLDRGVSAIELGHVAAQLHADAAAAGRALEHHRQADALRLRPRLRDIGKQTASRQQRKPVLLRQRPRAMLETEIRIWAGVGPMNTMPCAAQFSANEAFSLRKPYPGWIAFAPVARAASSSLSCLR